MILSWILGCTPLSAPEPPPEEPAPWRALPHPPPLRPIPAVGPADPSRFEIRPDGLGIHDEAPGAGDPVVPGVVVVAEITSWAPDGSMWDSTWERREPTRFLVGGEQVIPGWDQGILGMRPGGIRQLLIPPALGFEEGIAGRLPPGASCTTRLELLEILSPPEAPAPPGDLSQTVGGFRIRDLRIGDGPELTSGARARIDYSGWLPDGTLFDSTWSRSAPFAFPYGEGRIRWESAFLGMRVGGRREIAISSQEAFGVEGRSPVIPPETDLLFAVDLRSIE